MFAIKNSWVSYLLRWQPFLLIFLIFGSGFCQASILICIPGKTNTREIQCGFDTLLGPGKVLVFGRIRDLEATIPTAPDAAIITYAPYFTYTPGYKTVLAGKVGTASSEKYLLVAASPDVTMDNISEKKIGMVDFLGRTHLSTFAKSLFGIDARGIKRVNKDDDLLTMIGMEAVDAIIVSETHYREIQSNTKLSFTIVATSSKHVGFPVCAIKDARTSKACKRLLHSLPAPLAKALGIDCWEIR